VPPRGRYPSKFGFGEAVSTALISNVVDATKSCGAVRHGPECFNFWFPQEMDKDFLIVWDGYARSHATSSARIHSCHAASHD
jgi:hypothetical protein